MGALDAPLPVRAEAALAAGCDVVLYCSGDAADNEALAGTIGGMSEAATARLERAMAGTGKASAADFGALVEKRDALLAYA